MKSPPQRNRIRLSDGVLVNVDCITKRFLAVLALDGASLEIRRGEVHGLLGESGAGKSTLVKLLSGIYQPDGGSISIRGGPVHIADANYARALGIMTIYQQHTLAPSLSPIDNICLGRGVRRQLNPRLDYPAIIKRVRKLWKYFGGHAKALRCRVNELGGQEQCLVEIVKALALGAELMIMDEPTIALPEEARTDVADHIRKMRAAGLSVLLATRSLEKLLGLVDRVTIFRDGCSVATMPLSGTSIDEINREMLGREVSSMAAVSGRPNGAVIPDEHFDYNVRDGIVDRQLAAFRTMLAKPSKPRKCGYQESRQVLTD